MNNSKHCESLVRRFSRVGSTVVLGGHYCLAEDMSDLSHEGVAETASFRLGAKLVAATLAGKTDSRLVLWVNDIGIPPDQRSAIKADYRLPFNYQSILDEECLSEQRLLVCFESTMRNKASTLLRKLYKRDPGKFTKISSAAAGLIRCVGDSQCDVSQAGKMAYTIVGPAGEQLVVKDGSNPKCNLILAALFDSLSKTYRPRVQINIFNELYSYRIDLGVHVLRTLLGNDTPIVNVYCDDDRYFTQPTEIGVQPATEYCVRAGSLVFS